mgnify:CR=1 FL=1
MDMIKLKELHQHAIQKMNTGNFNGALNLTRKMQGLGPHYFVSYITSGLLIDIGSALGEEKVVNEGVESLKKDLEEIIQNKKIASTAYYNLANGYHSLFNFKYRKDRYVKCFKETELNQAKIYYRKALEYPIKDKLFASRLWTNLGNCFDQVGRVIEALDCYEEALREKPDHGMALGNKGLALLHYASLAGEHQGTFLIEAYSLLSQALNLGVDPEAQGIFTRHLQNIKNRFHGKRFLDNSLKYPGCKIKAKSKFEKFLIEFCLRNKLYLNICNFCQKCDAAIGDTVVIKKMLIPIIKGNGKVFPENDPYLRLSSYLNQIKQDYVIARFLLILSRYRGLNLNFADKRVTIIDTLDYSMHNVYIELVKASSKNFYDILDKIAYFINDYLKLGIDEKKISFQRVWFCKDKTVRKKIDDTKNFSLNALFDLHKDIEDGPYDELRKIRNALTHRFINVRMFQVKENEENMTEDTLVKQTLELAKLVRNAIIYLLYFVYVEEDKKEAKSKEISVPMYAQELPDNLKSNR